MRYYGRFRRSAMYPLLARINAYLVQWIRKKYKRLQGAHKANRKLREIALRHPRLFAHWHGPPQPGCDQDDKSRMNREGAPSNSALDRPCKGQRFGRR
jgi:hypothetical protein